MNNYKKYNKKAKKGLSNRAQAWWLIVILIAGLLAGFLDYPQPYNTSANWIHEKTGISIPSYLNKPFHLGLDLQGGTHLVYEADLSEIPTGEKSDALAGVRDVIERRVNALGVSEPVVQTTEEGNSYRVIAELAGVTDVNEAINKIGETPILEFKEENTEIRELTEEEQQQLEEANEKELAQANDILDQATLDNFSDLVTEYSEDFASKGKDGSIGTVTADGQYGLFFLSAQKTGPNAIHPQVVETPEEGYNILKIGEKTEETEIKARHILICYEDAQRCTSDYSQDEAWNKINELKGQVTAENFEDLAKEHSTEPAAAESGGDLGWFGRGVMVPEFENAVFDMETGTISDIVESPFGYHLIYKEDTRTKDAYEISRILVRKTTQNDIAPQDPYKNTDLSGKHLERAQVTFNPNTNEPQVSIEFNDEGKELFAMLTEKNVGSTLGIFLDGQPISLPTVNEKIADGRAVISGAFSIEEAKILARRLNAGALPVPITLISQQTVGASLGHESVTQSLEAALLGLLLVALFMIAYYRLPGLSAVLSLCLYGIFVLALFKLIPVTLTLAGIAGFILSIGMAVDANVLIFERLKEELRSGKPILSAIDHAFERAWSSIRDGNISTLITCVILGYMGSGIVKGFAVTLGIGILISMLSAVVINKIFLRLIAQIPYVQKTNWLFLGAQKSNQEQGE